MHGSGSGCELYTDKHAVYPENSYPRTFRLDTSGSKNRGYEPSLTMARIVLDQQLTLPVGDRPVAQGRDFIKLLTGPTNPVRNPAEAECGIDLSQLEQIVEHGQVRTIASNLRLIAGSGRVEWIADLLDWIDGTFTRPYSSLLLIMLCPYLRSRFPLSYLRPHFAGLLDRLRSSSLTKNAADETKNFGLDALCKTDEYPGDLVETRRFETAAAINRIRGLRVFASSFSQGRGPQGHTNGGDVHAWN